jgi:OmpA-OmpF porin, OOP family
MATMLDNLREVISPALASALSRETGESESAVSKGLSAAIPAIASMIANRSDDQGFVKTLADLAVRSSGTYPLEALSGPSSSASGIDMTSTTGAWLASLFGKNLSGVVDSIASFAGVKRSSAASLLSVGAPIVLGYLGRLVQSDHLSIASLGDLLRSQRAELAAAVPAGFEISEFATPIERSRTALGSATSSRWAMPLMALVAALGIAGFIWWLGHKPTEVARVEISEPSMKAVGTSGVLAGKFARTLPGNVTVVIPGAGSAEDRLSTHLASALARTTIKFDRISFESNSARLTPESSEQIDNIATILRAYPKASVTVAGHTDKVGSDAANLILSRSRATAVATRLIADGVPADRVHTVGYGSQKPAADNSTEAGRAQNRRIELEVTAK